MDKPRINVTKGFLPPIEEYQKYLQKIWDKEQLTNEGPLLKELEGNLREYLGVSNLKMVTNGTLALQLALSALDVDGGEVITTPFSYVATTSSILWQKCTPVFVDVEAETYCIDADRIEKAITVKTKAIMAVHVFGYACDIEKIEAIAEKHQLRVIYDGAHAFGAKYKGKSLLNYGDISMCSFHATKLFHTIEGGLVISKDKDIDNRVDLMKRFGHNGDKHITLGINAKASEFQAAMGLANMKYIDKIIAERRKLSLVYNEILDDAVGLPKPGPDLDYNYAYYPILFSNEAAREKVTQALNQENIFPRRYFYPSLNKLPYLKTKHSCPVSESLADRILCLPLYAGLRETDATRIAMIVKKNVK